MQLIKWIKVCFTLYRNKHTLQKCSTIVTDPRSNFARSVTDRLSLEEMEAVTDLERIHRLFNLSPLSLKKDLDKLKDSLDDKK